MPTYNRRDILLQTLASFEQQTVDPDRYEVIVAVDASTDGTVEALARLRPRYSLRWVSFEVNRGASAGANAAARLARYEVVIITGDDQVAAPGMVAAHLDAHQRHGVVLVQGEYPLAPGCDKSGASLAYERERKAYMARYARDNSGSWHIWAGNLSLRRETLLQIGGFDEKTFRYYGGEDTDLGLRIAALGIPFIYEPRALSHHIHVVSTKRFGQQAFSSGRALVRVARKHALPVESFRGSGTRPPNDRIEEWGWQRAPGVMRLIGHLLELGLRGADLVRLRPAQIAAARLIYRFYRVGGIVLEQSQAPMVERSQVSEPAPVG
jgi:GT2 family glycosyltransferase